MSLSVLLCPRNIILRPLYSKVFRFPNKDRTLHDGKTELFECTKIKRLSSFKHISKHTNNIELLKNRKFFSGTAQSGDETTYRKVERVGFKVLAKSVNILDTVRTSNELSVIKAAGRKLARTVCNVFRTHVLENDRVVAIRKELRQKYEEAQEQEKNK